MNEEKYIEKLNKAVVEIKEITPTREEKERILENILTSNLDDDAPRRHFHGGKNYFTYPLFYFTKLRIFFRTKRKIP